MGDPLALIRYLARSPTRARLLAAIVGSTRTRITLQAETDVPRSSLCRALAEFRRRELVTVDGDRYAITPLGKSIATRLTGLAESVGTVRRLQSQLAECLADGADARLADLPACGLSIATPADPEAPTRQVTDRVSSATRVGLITPVPLPDVPWGGVDGVTTRRRRIEVVIPRRILESTRLPLSEMSPRRRPAIVGTPAVFAYDGEVPSFRGFADATAFLAVTDDAGTIRGCVETDDGVVLSRVEETVEAYVADADPVPAGVLRE